MHKVNKILLCMIVVLIFLPGCSYKKKNANIDNGSIQSDTFVVSTPNIDNTQEIYYYIGTKLKALSDIPDIDNPAIIVNGCVITKRDIESEKIRGEFADSFDLKEKIQNLIREKIEIADAIRLGIEPNREELDDYLYRVKKTLNNDADAREVIQAYMDAMEITQEEFLREMEDAAYTNYQRMAWWEAVRPEETIFAEAKERNVNVNDVNYEYHEKYVDEMVKKTQIDILDSNIEKILSS